MIGEPQRAFYGNQYSLTLPVFTHYGVTLWVPEVGGPIDPDSEAHDLVMSVFGGVSKGERTRIRIRVRAAMAAQAKLEGRFLGGRPPYGYRLADAGPHPNPAKAADGKRLHRLVPDLATAGVVRRIFAEFLAGFGIWAIAQRLTNDGILCPSAHDAPRNPHRAAIAWSRSAVRTILMNPRYTGYQVWNRQRKEELLIDVEDVALGHRTQQTWNPKDAWIFSDQQTHTPLVSLAMFNEVQNELALRGPQSQREVKPTQHAYAFKGVLFHQSCERRIQGNWNHGRAHYRCRYPKEYALANTIDHPRAVYVREDALLDPVDHWLAKIFAPDRIEHSLTTMEQAQSAADLHQETAHQTIQECDRKLKQYRAVLEAGGDPATVATWTREVQTQRTTAQTALDDTRKRTPVMNREEIRSTVESFGGLLTLLHRADPSHKGEFYRRLRLRLTYDHETRLVLAETRPGPTVDLKCVSEGGLEPPRPLKGTSTSS
ncbi:Recombinase [Actinobacteria bacterium OK074]|nr:Recombinase [Actinobacteria bacterium OK074]